jgi:hypothetical protein
MIMDGKSIMASKLASKATRTEAQKKTETEAWDSIRDLILGLTVTKFWTKENVDAFNRCAMTNRTMATDIIATIKKFNKDIPDSAWGQKMKETGELNQAIIEKFRNRMALSSGDNHWKAVSGKIAAKATIPANSVGVMVNAMAVLRDIAQYGESQSTVRVQDVMDAFEFLETFENGINDTDAATLMDYGTNKSGIPLVQTAVQWAADNPSKITYARDKIQTWQRELAGIFGSLAQGAQGLANSQNVDYVFISAGLLALLGATTCKQLASLVKQLSQKSKSDGKLLEILKRYRLEDAFGELRLGRADDLRMFSGALTVTRVCRALMLFLNDREASLADIIFVRTGEEEVKKLGQAIVDTSRDPNLAPFCMTFCHAFVKVLTKSQLENISNAVGNVLGVTFSAGAFSILDQMTRTDANTKDFASIPKPSLNA